MTVKVKNEGENSRWYSGSGIYRHVWLQVVSPVHIATWGTYITTPQVTEKEAVINIKTTVVNNSGENSKIKLTTKIFNTDKKEQTQVETEKTIDPGKTVDIVQDMKLNNPSLWSTDSPALYNAMSEISVPETLIDLSETKFGIRSLSFDAVNGFVLMANLLN